ncbi:hypothetical protein E4U28_001761 [Claviceps purpurea]|nr:hypothetical protein E4U28_001761 [Claviceps purpurea]
MASSKYSFSTILLPAESAQTSRCGPSRATQCHVTQSHILPAAGHPSRATRCHVTGSQILPGAGHNAPHLPLPQPQPVQRQEGVWYSRSHISTDQLAPILLAELPATTNLAPLEAAAEEHRSAVLGVNLKAHKAKATKEAQDRRNRNAQASKRSRLKKSAKEKAEATKREQEMKQELEDAKSESRKKDAEIERLRGVDAEIERLRGVDAENERLKRQVEELQQKK